MLTTLRGDAAARTEPPMTGTSLFCGCYFAGGRSGSPGLNARKPYAPSAVR